MDAATMSHVMDQLKAAQSERSAIRDDLRSMRHLMTDFWMADAIQSMSKGGQKANAPKELDNYQGPISQKLQSLQSLQS